MNCPYCRTTIPDDALVCAQCTRDLRTPEAVGLISTGRETQLEAEKERRSANQATGISVAAIAGFFAALLVLILAINWYNDRKRLNEGAEFERRIGLGAVQPPTGSDPAAPGQISAARMTTFTFAVQGGEQITATGRVEADVTSKHTVVFSPFVERTDGNLYNAALHIQWNIYGKNRGLFQLEQAQLRPEPTLGGQAICWPITNPVGEFCVFPTKDEATGRIAALTVWMKP